MMAQSLSRIVTSAKSPSKHPLHRHALRCISSLSLSSARTARLRCKHGQRSFYTFVQQYQRAVTLTFGKLTSVKEPGFRVYLPILQTMYKVDMRTRVHELVPQHIITRDNVSCSVTAVIYYHVIDAEKAVLRVTDVDQGTYHGLIVMI